MPTGSLPAADSQQPKSVGVAEQPFPADRKPPYKLVFVANGRAMIEDNSGLWVVQIGSNLPDSSSVNSIEQRNGKWAIVTSGDVVVSMSDARKK